MTTNLLYQAANVVAPIIWNSPYIAAAGVGAYAITRPKNNYTETHLKDVLSAINKPRQVPKTDPQHTPVRPLTATPGQSISAPRDKRRRRHQGQFTGQISEHINTLVQAHYQAQAEVNDPELTPVTTTSPFTLTTYPNMPAGYVGDLGQTAYGQAWYRNQAAMLRRMYPGQFKRYRYAAKYRRPLRSRYTFKRAVRKVVNFMHERKNIDTDLADTVDNTWSFLPLGLVAQGTGGNQRIGRKITTTSLEFMMSVQPQVANIPVVGSAFRCIVFIDKDCGGAVPAATTVFTADAANALQNPDFVHRFKIIHDVTHSIGNRPGTTAATDPEFLHSHKQRLRLNLSYDLNTAAIGACEGWHPFIGFASTTATDFTVAGTARIWFIDP